MRYLLIEMMGKTHVAAGALLTAAAAPPTLAAFGIDLSPEEVLISTGIGAIAGILPDIDHPQSGITKGDIPGARLFGAVGVAVTWALSLPPRIIGVGARATMNHRGGTHSAVFMVGWSVLAAPVYAGFALLIALIASLILNPLAGLIPDAPQIQIGALASWMVDELPRVMPLVGVSVFWGYLAHLLTDSMTKVPVPWPWPFSRKRFSILPKPMRITTDSFVENAIIRPIIILALVLVLALRVAVPLASSAADSLGLSDDDSPTPAKTNQHRGAVNRPD